MDSIRALHQAMGIAAAAMTLAAGVPAQAEQTEQMLPYIAPSNCRASVTLPDRASGVMFSRNCQIAFVLPPKFGEVTYNSNFSASANIMECAHALENSRSIRQWEEALRLTAAKIVRLLAAERPDFNALQKLREEAKEYQGFLEMDRVSYRGVPGGRVRLAFDGTTPESLLGEFREKNHQLTEMTGLRFERAPIGTGYLSFDYVQASVAQQQVDPPVLSSSINGVAYQGARDTIVMNGTAAGSVDLSLHAACGILLNTDIKRPIEAQLDMQKATAYLSANYTYAVPVQTGFSYDASVNVDNSLQIIADQTKTSGRFSINDLLRVHGSGHSNEACSITSVVYEMPEGDQSAKKSFEEELKGEVCGRLLTRITDRLEKSGYVRALDRQGASETATAPGGNTSQTQYRRECRSSSILGIRVSSSCGDVPYEVLTWHDGMSQKTLESENQTSWAESEHLEALTVMNRWKTMGFLMSQPAAIERN